MFFPFLKIGVRILATKLVEQWLKIAKGETMTLNSNNIINSVNTQKDAAPSAAPMPIGTVSSTAAVTTATVPASTQSPTTMTKKPIFINQNSVEAIKDYQPSEDPLDIRNESGAEYTTGDETDSKLSPSNYNDGLVYKLTVRDGKQILAKVNDTSPRKAMSNSVKSSDSDESNETMSDKEKLKTKIGGSSSSDKKIRSDKDSNSSSSGKSRDHKDKLINSSSKDGKSIRDREKERKSGDSSHKSSGSKSSKHSSSSISTGKEKEKISSSKSNSSSSSGHKSSSSSHKNSSSKSSSHKSNSSSSSSRDKDKHRSSASSSTSSKSSSSSSSSKDKEKKDGGGSQADKDKATLAKVLPNSISKMPKIPKKSTNEEGADATTVPLAKKSSISIEVRKDIENRPKTVKTFNSKFRSHGLAEEAPPPPSRRDIKKTTPTTTTTTTVTTSNSPTTTTNVTPSPIIAPKRSLSPIQATKDAVAEKKIKLDTPVVEKPGAIKLIPAKPKRKYIFFKDMTNPCFSLLFILLQGVMYCYFV